MESRKYLYFCDGKACSQPDICYMTGGECHHTTDEQHAITKCNKSIPTYFKIFNPADKDNDIFIEKIDEIKFLQHILHEEQS